MFKIIVHKHFIKSPINYFKKVKSVRNKLMVVPRFLYN